MTTHLFDRVVSLDARRLPAGDGIRSGLFVPQRPGSLPLAGADVAVRDGAVLLAAVKERLRRTATDLSPDAAGQALASVLECVAALEQLQTTLAHAFTRRQARDTTLPALSALPEYTVLAQRLADALAEGAGGALIAIDLGELWALNESHGRDVGATAQRLVATRLARAVRSDDTVSRVGGDQFLLLLAAVPNEHALSQVACKLFDAISAPMSIGTLRLTVRPSLGVAALPFAGGSADEVLGSARSAMRRARRNQCGYVLFDPFDDG